MKCASCPEPARELTRLPDTRYICPNCWRIMTAAAGAVPFVAHIEEISMDADGNILRRFIPSPEDDITDEKHGRTKITAVKINGEYVEIGHAETPSPQKKQPPPPPLSVTPSPPQESTPPLRPWPKVTPTPFNDLRGEGWICHTVRGKKSALEEWLTRRKRELENCGYVVGQTKLVDDTAIICFSCSRDNKTGV